MNGDGEAIIVRANGLDNFARSVDYKGKLKTVSNYNQKDNEQFDILIANPPYSVNSFKSTIKWGDESFELYSKLTDNSSEIECLFVERMKQLLLYFLLTCTQRTVITKVGDKQEEKDFIGYSFSNRRGHEGIQMLPNGTKLYDEGDCLNSEKANSYVYNAFCRNYDDIDESMADNISLVETTSLFDFSQSSFEKIIDLRGNIKLHFETNYSIDKINTRVDLIKGVTYEKGDQVYQETSNVILTADNITLNNHLDIVKRVFLRSSFVPKASSKLYGEDIFICLSSGSCQHIGKVAYVPEDMQFYAGGFMGILRKKPMLEQEKEVSMKYVYAILSSKACRVYVSEISKGKGSNIKNLNDYIGNIRIPFPPYDVQKEIDCKKSFRQQAINLQ